MCDLDFAITRKQWLIVLWTFIHIYKARIMFLGTIDASGRHDIIIALRAYLPSNAQFLLAGHYNNRQQHVLSRRFGTLVVVIKKRQIEIETALAALAI